MEEIYIFKRGIIGRPIAYRVCYTAVSTHCTHFTVRFTPLYISFITPPSVAAASLAEPAVAVAVAAASLAEPAATAPPVAEPAAALAVAQPVAALAQPAAAKRPG